MRWDVLLAQTTTDAKKAEYDFKRQQLMEQGATRLNQIAEGYDRDIGSCTQTLEDHVKAEYKRRQPNDFIESDGFKLSKALVGLSSAAAKQLGSKLAGPLGSVKGMMDIMEGTSGSIKLVLDWNNTKLSAGLTKLGNEMLKTDYGTQLLFATRTMLEHNRAAELSQVKQAYQDGLDRLKTQYGF